MDYNKITEKTLEVFQDCHIYSFPIDCFAVLGHYGYKVYTYDELQTLNTELYNMCREYSDDAFRDGNSMVVAYNKSKPPSRIRFSLMHELGHHILRHKHDSKENEKEANIFASCILAPRMAIHYSKCQNLQDVHDIFLLSSEASDHAFNDYRRWHRMIAYHMSITDKSMYRHFYSPTRKCFIWNEHSCDFCGAPLYNTLHKRCTNCSLPSISTPSPQPELFHQDNNALFHKLEHHWLYSDNY